MNKVSRARKIIASWPKQKQDIIGTLKFAEEKDKRGSICEDEPKKIKIKVLKLRKKYIGKKTRHN